MLRHRTLTTTTALTGAALSAALFAAAPAAAQPNLTGWSYGGLYDDWRASSVVGGDVLTIGGQDVGDVTDMTIDEDGLIQSVIVETDANLTPRGAFFEVPFRDVDVDPETFSVTLIQDLEAAEDIETTDRAPAIDPGEWKASMLVGMPAMVDGEGWGRVDDLMFDSASRTLTAYVIEPTVGDVAMVAMPFDVSMIATDSDVLEVPFGPEAVEALELFDTGMM